MSTFLELCNDVARESGTLGQSLTTVSGVTGRAAKVVAWTRQAWEMIQRERTDWTFRQKQFLGTLVIDDMVYSASDLSITDFGGWLRPSARRPNFSIYENALGRADETLLVQIPFEVWLSLYDIGDPDSTRPIHVTVDQDRALRFGNPPDKAYKVRGWYNREVQSLAADDDEPYIDAQYHQAIVWRALMLLGDDDESAFEVASSTTQYRHLYSQLVREFTPGIELA